MTSLRSLLACAALLAVACGPSGHAPEVQPLEDVIVAVSQELVIRIDASDPDGDPLSYSFDAEVPEIRSRASISQLPIGAGEFRWTPMASDVGVWFFDFKVSDGDYTSTATVKVDVRSAVGANSAPRFLQPVSNGTTLDLSQKRCLTLDIVIDDSDSVDVEITEAEPTIDGAELVQTDGLTAEWSWCPTPEQINASSRHTLSLIADDGDNPPTILHYLIVLRRAGKDNCPGDAPVVDHVPIDQSTVGNVTISADITDDKGIKDAPILFYSTVMPSTPPNLSTMSLATMSKASGSTWTAKVPSPVATAAVGSTAQLYYVILVRDDDDLTGSCDHESLAPEVGAYSMKVTNPGGNGGLGLCEACIADTQCGDSADDLCVRVGSGSGGYCLSSCTDGSCPSGYFCSAQPVESVQGASARQCLPEGETCEIECTDDAYEDNDSRAQAAQKAPLAVGTTSATSCPLSLDDDDEDWWQIVLPSDADVDLQLNGSAATDLDLHVYDANGAFVLGSSGFNSNEQVALCLSAGTYYVRVVANNIGANDYTLEYSAVSSTCETPVCVDDDLEENDGISDATMVILSPAGDYDKLDRKICPGDEDWYAVSLFDGETLEVLIDFVHANGDLDIGIIGADGSTVYASGVSQTDGEQTLFTLDDPSCTPENPSCLFYVVVVGFDGAQNSYDLLLAVEAP